MKYNYFIFKKVQTPGQAVTVTQTISVNQPGKYTLFITNNNLVNNPQIINMTFIVYPCKFPTFFQ